jgi:CRISPR-associated protein Csd2
MNNRYDFVFLFDVTDANPNGDPDAGNLPRVDPETGHGLVTDVCLKRKVRNFVSLVHRNEPPNEIYVVEKAILNQQHERAYHAVGAKPGKGPNQDAKAWMCRNFYDIRTFGAVMSTKVNCGQVRGPVQFGFSRSVDPVVTLEHAVTRCAVATEKEATAQEGDNRTMGRKFTVPYAMYRCHGFVNPFLAEQTGFGDDDLELLWKALENAFQFDQSAARPAGSMATRKLVLFKHDNQLGRAPSHELLERVTVSRRTDAEVPRRFADYDVEVDRANLPDGVEIIERV